MQIFLKEDNRHPKRKITVLTILKFMMGNSLEVQWLGLHAFSVVAWVQSLVREVRCYNLHSMAKNNNKIHDGCPKKDTRNKLQGLPDGSVVKTSPFNARDTSMIPDPGRSHMLQSNRACVPQLLSLFCGAQEPQPLGPEATTTEACTP